MTSVCGEGLAAGSAEEAREALERVRLGGKRVGLLVGDHLQAVLDAAEMLVGRGQLVARFLADPALGRERIERLERLGRTQRRRAAAGDQLLGLHEKLDLADAAAAELDVVAGDGDLLVAAKGVDLPLHRMHVGDRRMVEIAPPDEGESSFRNASPAARSPAQGRALMKAARSQVWPSRS